MREEGGSTHSELIREQMEGFQEPPHFSGNGSGVDIDQRSLCPCDQGKN